MLCGLCFAYITAVMCDVVWCLRETSIWNMVLVFIVKRAQLRAFDDLWFCIETMGAQECNLNKYIK